MFSAGRAGDPGSPGGGTQTCSPAVSWLSRPQLPQLPALARGESQGSLKTPKAALYAALSAGGKNHSQWPPGSTALPSTVMAADENSPRRRAFKDCPKPLASGLVPGPVSPPQPWCGLCPSFPELLCSPCGPRHPLHLPSPIQQHPTLGRQSLNVRFCRTLPPSLKLWWQRPHVCVCHLAWPC